MLPWLLLVLLSALACGYNLGVQGLTTTRFNGTQDYKVLLALILLYDCPYAAMPTTEDVYIHFGGGLCKHSSLHSYLCLYEQCHG